MTKNVVHKKWLMLFYLAWSFQSDLFYKAFKHRGNIMHLLSYSLINTKPIMPLVTIMGHVYYFSLWLPVKRCFQSTGFFVMHGKILWSVRLLTTMHVLLFNKSSPSLRLLLELRVTVLDRNNSLWGVTTIFQTRCESHLSSTVVTHLSNVNLQISLQWQILKMRCRTEIRAVQSIPVTLNLG